MFGEALQGDAINNYQDYKYYKSYLAQIIIISHSLSLHCGTTIYEIEIFILFYIYSSLLYKRSFPSITRSDSMC